MSKKPTEIQNKICNTNGKFVVRACPGSGKTFTVSAKMEKILNNWPYSHQGVATLSFTNIAWQEIEKELKNTFLIDVPLQHPHFLGTIDSFINNYIFFPYGHLILGCEGRPTLVGEPAYPWKKRQKDPYYNQFFDKISYDADGNILTTSKVKLDLNNLKHLKNVQQMKINFHRLNGYVNQSDANYFSLKLLEKYGSIAKKIALRFPYIIIDEAQDTSDIQMKIIDIIVKNGLKNIVLVGDPDQAIFEFNSAKPELFLDKSKEWGEIIMNENLRSSQKICDFTHPLTNLNKPSLSINKKVKDYDHVPEIWGYESLDSVPDLIDSFLEKCEEFDINSDNIAILVRSKNLINEIISARNIKAGISAKPKNNLNIWNQENFLRELAHSKYLYDNLEFQKSFKLLEKTFINILEKNPINSDYELSKIIEEIGYFKFKEFILELINLMPHTEESIGEWKDEFEVNLNNSDNDFPINFEIDDEGRNTTFDDLFSFDISNNKTYKHGLSTIHKVKGETFESTLLILKRKSTGPYYKTLLTANKKTADNEELRNVYVGITRPQKVLVLMVPCQDLEYWENYFYKKSTVSEEHQVVSEEKQATLESFFNQKK